MGLPHLEHAIWLPYWPCWSPFLTGAHTIALDFPIVSYDGGRTPVELHPQTFSGERCPSVTLCHFHKHISVTSRICVWSVYVDSYVPLLQILHVLSPAFKSSASACSTSLFFGNVSCCSLTPVAQCQCGGTSSYNAPLPCVADPDSLLWHCHWAGTDGSPFPFLPLTLGNAMTYDLHG